MLNNTSTNIERIIAKIDNDFNPDNSDWIPRVAAWTIDAMQQLSVLKKDKKIKKIKVNERLAYTGCNVEDADLKVYDTNGCEIEKAVKGDNCCNALPTGDLRSEATSVNLTPNTIDIIDNENAKSAPDYTLAETVNAKDYPDRYNIREFKYGRTRKRNYVLIDCDKIELNFDTDYITISYLGLRMQHSDMYGCELPVVPNNGILIEAIVNYCMYKMLCRGLQHPVMNLQASQYGTNPYYTWTILKRDAKRSIILDAQGEVIDDGGQWRNGFYNYTFNPRG